MNGGVFWVNPNGMSQDVDDSSPFDEINERDGKHPTSGSDNSNPFEEFENYFKNKDSNNDKDNQF